MNAKGPSGALRREACKAGCPTIIMEGGEVWKVEPGHRASATRGIRNVLRALEMLDGPAKLRRFRSSSRSRNGYGPTGAGSCGSTSSRATWSRKASPSRRIRRCSAIEQNTLYAPFDAVVIGMTTLPPVGPGEAICNLGKLPERLPAR